MTVALILLLVCEFVTMASLAVLLLDRRIDADLPWWWPGEPGGRDVRR